MDYNPKYLFSLLLDSKMSVDIFGNCKGYGKAGPRGPPGEVGPPGKRGRNSGFYPQYFQHITTKWDIDYEPNFWIEGYDVQEKPTFKVLNKYDHTYDGSPKISSKPPVKGADPVTGRHTLRFDGSQYIVCPMNWNGTLHKGVSYNCTNPRGLSVNRKLPLLIITILKIYSSYL